MERRLRICISMSSLQSVWSCTRCHAVWRPTLAGRRSVSTVQFGSMCRGLPLGLLQPAGGPLIATRRARRWSISGLVLATWPNCLRRLSWMISDTRVQPVRFLISHGCWLQWTRILATTTFTPSLYTINVYMLLSGFKCSLKTYFCKLSFAT